MDFKRDNRDKNTLKPLALTAYDLFITECRKEGLTLFPTDFLRTKERQWYLYCGGRTAAEANKAGVPLEFAKLWARPNEKQVTWTLNSNHMGGMAWDMAVSPPKALYDKNELNKAAAVAKRLGIGWGGSYGDSPHFEITPSWKPPKQEDEKPIAPEWQVKAQKEVREKLQLDEAYWKDEKINEPLTRGEFFGVINKIIK